MFPEPEYPRIETSPGVTRRVLASDQNLMVVFFRFASCAEGATHSHPHVQATFVKSGRFAFTVGETQFEVGPGDAFVIPSGVPHGCRALEAGELIDSFTPRRDDFL